MCGSAGAFKFLMGKDCNRTKLTNEIFAACIFKSSFYYFCALYEKTVGIAQLVRASDCGSEGRRFEPGYLPSFPPSSRRDFLFISFPNLFYIVAMLLNTS